LCPADGPSRGYNARPLFAVILNADGVSQ
jgi:hypothetical protein